MSEVSQIKPIIDLIETVGVIGLLAWIIWSGGMKKVPSWIFYWIHLETIKVRDKQFADSVAEYKERIEELIEDRDARLKALSEMYELRLQEKDADAAMWRDIALKATGVAEDMVDLKKRGAA